MRFLLDTNAVIAALKGHPGLLAHMHRHETDDFGLPAVVLHELYYGASKSAHPVRNLAVVDALRFAVLEFDREDAREAGAIRAALARAGTPIGPYDVLIAGQAKARGLTLITRNRGEFARVPGVRTEDWHG